MKKYIMNFASGFTMAEFLISMLVSGILLAALVPVIGIKKVKHNTIHFNHGIAECYYDNAGTLHYFYAINRKGSPMNVEGVVKDSDHCEFAVPKSQYLQIFVIGAGTNSGGTSLSDFEAEESAPLIGEILPNGNFQANIDALDGIREGLADKIRNAMNFDWHPTIKYKFESPRAIGGKGRCKAVRIDNLNSDRKAKCDEACGGPGKIADHTSCNGPLRGGDPDIKGSWYNKLTDAALSFENAQEEPFCWAFVHSKGGESGYGKSYTFTTTLTGDTLIEYTQTHEETKVSITGPDGNHPVTLTAPEEGESAADYDSVNKLFPPLTKPLAGDRIASKCIGDCHAAFMKELNGEGGNPAVFTSGSRGGKESPSSSYDCEDYYTEGSNVAQIGKIEQTPIHYRYHPYKFHVKYSRGGNHGIMEKMIVEKLTGKLDLYPASYAKGQPASYVKRGDNGIVIVSAASGELLPEGEKTVEGSYTISTVDDVDSNVVDEIKRQAVPDNEGYFEEYLSKIKSSKFKGGLLGCEKTYKCPGFGGSGPFLNINFNGEARKDYTFKMWTGDTPDDPAHPDKTYTHGIAKEHSTASCGSFETKALSSGDGGVHAEYCTPYEYQTFGQEGAVIIVW